jgi:hypothetical protein
METFVLVIVCIAVAALVAFLIKRNIQDKAALEKQLNEDYKKPEDNEGDIMVEENMQ